MISGLWRLSVRKYLDGDGVVQASHGRHHAGRFSLKVSVLAKGQLKIDGSILRAHGQPAARHQYNSFRQREACITPHREQLRQSCKLPPIGRCM